jgi:histidine triad (HIT) family protein
MNCQYCDRIKAGEAVFEDDMVAVLLHKAPATPGHVLLVPKEHHTIIEQTPDPIVRKLAVLANKISNSLLNLLGANGTNLIIENGTGAEQQIPHLALNIIPRFEGDGLNFQWQPKKLSDEQMGLAELQLKEQANALVPEPEKRAPIMVDKGPGEQVRKGSYLITQLRRTP